MYFTKFYSKVIAVCEDGLSEMDPTVSPSSMKNQIVGLLQATRYLKGIFINCY
jgi:hypothetical protein